MDERDGYDGIGRPNRSDAAVRVLVEHERPEWFAGELRYAAEDRGMRSAPWAETSLDEVLAYLRERV